ncbi:lytic transglycosylase domain-containing protein [Rhodobacteraceae bacterium XHP0102]|nr:lytic transglycosylase domain-containing protein [Rhodobacteraceae bacterium XHP0102]
MIGLVGAMGTGALAQDGPAPPPWPEFNARRVTVPSADHQGTRINIQIDPALPQTARTPDLGADGANAAGAHSRWFWDHIPDGREGGMPRFEAALTLIANSQDKQHGFSADGLGRLASEFGTVILRETIETRVSPALALAILAVESGGATDAVSRAGAQGVMQLIPDTAARFNVDDPFDPAQNIRGGVAYLDFLMGRFERDPLLVIAAYNAGEGAIDAAQGVPNYAETRAYVPKVAEAWQVARLLCITPPDLISDGCVFATIAP